MSLQSGYLVGPYEIVSPLGAGGMGEVYRARDRKLDREVALKVLPPDLVGSAEHLRRFEQEARAASALNHPNIITIYDIGRSDTVAYMAMELVEGRDLRELMEDALPLKQILRIACKVADGLAAAHERGIVHRDLKPENIMISRDGFVKILDFGLAKLIRPFTDNATTAPHTTPGAVFGTVGYMSPEQAAGRSVDFRSDQFALGVILYEVLARRRPFDRPSPPETMTAIIREEPPSLAKIEGGIPPELHRVLTRCLEKDPNDRYASTRDLARDLREVRDHLTPTTSGKRSAGYGISTTSRMMPVAIGAVLVIALLALGAYFVMKPNGRESPSGPLKMRSLAVLPFRDLSRTGDGQMFTDGVSATITARLAQSRAVRVAAPFDGAVVPPNADLKEIARRRGADLVLQGGVQHAQNQVRVNFSLLDAATGTQIGGDTITGSSADLFALEDRVAERVLQTLRVPVDRARISSIGVEGAEDQKAYTEAVGFLQQPRNEKSVDEAIARLQKLLANSRDSAAVNSWLGRALYFKSRLSRRPGLMEEATVYAERAVETGGGLADTHVTLGLLRLATGRHADAMTEFGRAIAIQPNSTDAILGLADTYLAMGRATEAERRYKQVIQIRPDLPTAHNRYAFFCYTRGRYAEAAEHYRMTTEAAPDNPIAFKNLGATYHLLGRYDDAQRAYERSLSIAPTAATYSNLGTVRYFLGRFDDAVPMFEKATELAPNDYLVFANLGDARRWSTRDRERAAAAYDRAIKLADEAISVNPKDPLVHAVVASCLAKRDREDEAAKAISTALKLDPTDKDVLYQAAIVAHLRDNDDAALTWLERAVDAGYSKTDVQRDPELISLRSNATFQRLVSGKT